MHVEASLLVDRLVGECTSPRIKPCGFYHGIAGALIGGQVRGLLCTLQVLRLDLEGYIMDLEKLVWWYIGTMCGRHLRWLV